MWKEFKQFIMRGNVIDLAVGVIIGGAFGKIVSSLVADVLMPLIGIILGGIDFSGLKVRIGGVDATPVYLAYGQFLQALLDFLIIAAAIFMMIRLVNKLQKPAPATLDNNKECPYCKSAIHLQASRCPHCTAQL